MNFATRLQFRFDLSAKNYGLLILGKISGVIEMRL
jgi:hypothetical protein